MGFGTFGSGQGFTNIDEAPQNGQTWGRRDAQWARVVALIGDTMTGPLILSGEPAVPLQAVTKAYADAPDDGFSYLRRGAQWVVSPTELIFGAQFPFNITGNENVNTQYNFNIPASRLPFPAFDYLIAGNGLGMFWFSNKGSTGTPSGVWRMRIFTNWNDGTGPNFQAFSTTDPLETIFTSGANTLYRPPIDLDAQLRFTSRAQGTTIPINIICMTPPTAGAATLIFGVEGLIVGGGTIFMGDAGELVEGT